MKERLVNKNKIQIGCLNTSDKDIILKHNENIAIASPVEELKDKIPEIQNKDIEEQLKELDLSHLNAYQKDQIKNVIRDNIKAFSTKKDPLGLIKGAVHEIITEPGKVSYVNQYRQPQCVRKQIEELADDLLARGIVRHCSSPWNSPILLVTKKMVQQGSRSTLEE